MDKEIAEIKERMSKGNDKGFREDDHDTLWFEDCVYVPNVGERSNFKKIPTHTQDHGDA